MRLTDADAMLQRLQAWNTADSMDKAHYNFTRARIMEQPTAYDVDKVIEKLEAKKIHRFHEASGRSNYKSLAQGYIQAIQDAIDIVKRGGI